MANKVILIQGLLAPYRLPIFEEISKNKQIDLEVWFMGRGRDVKNRIWNETALRGFSFKYRFLDGTTINFGKKDIYPIWFNLNIIAELLKHRPDVIVMMGWDSLTSFLAHIYAVVYKTKFVLYSDSTENEKSWRRVVTKPLVKWHVNSSSALISGGTRSKRYLLSLGAKREKIFVSYNTINVKKYKEDIKKAKGFNKSFKQELGIPQDKLVIMYYAQMIYRKAPDLLLFAYQKLKEQNDNLALLLVGDGVYKKKLERIIRKRRIKDIIILSNPGDEEIINHYSIADIFVLPSREDVWGLVVNEAMCASIPVVVSDIAGVSEDLVADGINGFIFKSDDEDDLYRKLATLVNDTNLRKKMGEESCKIIDNFNPKLTVKKFIQAIL